MKKITFFFFSLTMFSIMFSSVTGAPLTIVEPILLSGSLLVNHGMNGALMAGVQINNITQDYVYQKAKGLLSQLKNPDGSAVKITDQMLTQSTIRSEVAMSTGATTFHIPITVNDAQNGQNSQYNTMRLLTLQDLFVVTELSIQVAKPTSAADAAFEVFTYPTLEMFTANANAAILGAFNNGYISYTNNNRVITPYWDLKRHLKIPVTQYQLHTGFATGTATFDAQDGSTDGFYPVEPGWVLSGGANMQMNINLPAAMANVDAFSRFVVQMRGILLQNLSGIR